MNLHNYRVDHTGHDWSKISASWHWRLPAHAFGALRALKDVSFDRRADAPGQLHQTLLRDELPGWCT